MPETIKEEVERVDKEDIANGDRQLAEHKGHFLLRKPVTSPWVNRNLANEQDAHPIDSHK